MKKIYAGIASVVLLLAIGWWFLWPRPIARPDYVPRTVALRSDKFYVYPPQGTMRGTIIFFGNDVGFWQPHQELADFLSRDGYAVVGFDLRSLFTSVANLAPADRENIVGDSLSVLMFECLAEFHGEKLPLVLMGHSLGAEVSIWASSHIGVPKIDGVVAMAPGGRGHLAITASDYLSSSLPSGPDSFSMSQLVSSAPRTVRIALVRGTADKMGAADPGILAAGASRMKSFPIPLAGHSLKKILIARYVVRDALGWVLAPQTEARRAGN